MKDYVIKATSGNGEIRAYVGNTREMVEQARVNPQHNKSCNCSFRKNINCN